jgi:hypothetical protein
MIGPKPDMILSQPNVEMIRVAEEKKEKAKSQKISCIKRNKEILEDKIMNGEPNKEIYDPQNELYLENIQKKQEKLEKRKLISKKQKINSDSDELMKMEEDLSENDPQIEEELIGILSQKEMLERMTAWSIEKDDLVFIPRIYVKNFKKIKAGLRKVFNDIAVLFREINVNHIFGINQVEKDYIQAVYTRMTYLLRRHIWEKISKKVDKVHMIRKHGNNWRNKRKINGINDETLEENKREKLAEWDRKEDALIQFIAECKNLKELQRQEWGILDRITDEIEGFDEQDIKPDKKLLEESQLRATSWLHRIGDEFREIMNMQSVDMFSVEKFVRRNDYEDKLEEWRKIMTDMRNELNCRLQKEMARRGT